MRDKDLPSFISTETIDLDNVFTRNVTSSGSFDLGGTLTTSLGKLLQTIPIPTMLVDGACAIVFANEAFRKLSTGGESIRLGSFAGLFPDPAVAVSSEAMIRDVFSTRRPATKEHVLRIGTRRMFGRLHLRPLRVGRRRTVLVIVEDLTRERRAQSRESTNLPRTDRSHGHIEQRLQTRTAQLRLARERLRKEISDRTRMERILQRIEQEYGAEALRRIEEQMRADEESGGPKADNQRACSVLAAKATAQALAAETLCAGGKAKNIFQQLTCAAKAALSDLAAGDADGARDQLEHILKQCRASGRGLHRLKTDRH
jgi:hypothetical protein